MDATSNANLINSVAEGTTIPCPACGAALPPDSQFCTVCGQVLEQKAPEADAPAFAPVEEETPAFAPVEEDAPAFAPVEEEAPAFAPAEEETPAFAPAEEEVPAKAPKHAYVEPVSVFADGLPAWDIEPPQVVVRKR